MDWLTWLTLSLEIAGVLTVGFLVWRDERHDVDRLADPAPTADERIREALAEAIRLARERDPDPDIAQWQDELDEAGQP